MLVAKKKPTSARVDWPTKLVAIRERYKVSQREAAERVGTVVRSWQNWEYGRRVPNAMAAKLIDLIFPMPKK